MMQRAMSRRAITDHHSQLITQRETAVALLAWPRAANLALFVLVSVWTLTAASVQQDGRARTVMQTLTNAAQIRVRILGSVSTPETVLPLRWTRSLDVGLLECSGPAGRVALAFQPLQSIRLRASVGMAGRDRVVRRTSTSVPRHLATMQESVTTPILIRESILATTDACVFLAMEAASA